MTITKENFKRNNINFIQFVMAVLVIYSHAFPIATGMNDGEIIKDITSSKYSFGNLAVATFFIYSGFLVSASYENSGSLFTYLKKRIFRIFPGLLAVLTICAVILGPCVTTLPVSDYFKSQDTWKYISGIFLSPVFWNLPGVFENNVYSSSVNGSLWTIPYQFCFYILLGILGFLGLLKYRKLNLTMLVGFIIAYLKRDVLFPGVTHFLSMPLYDWLYLGMYFTAGMTAYAYRDKICLNKQGAMIALSLLIFSWAAEEYFVSTTLMGTYLLLYLAYCTKPISFPLSKLSFGIYIYGFPVQQLFVYLFGGQMNPYLNMVFSIPVTVFLAYLSDKFIEAPAAKLERKISFNVPQFMAPVINKVSSLWTSLLGRIANLSWRTYFALLLVVVIGGWALFINVPSSVDFSGAGKVSSRAVKTGFYERVGDETFTFVSRVSTLNLGQKNGMQQLEISGFLPESFDDVEWITVYCNGNVVLKEAPLTAGQGFNFDIVIPENNTLWEKQTKITLEFNAIHAQAPDSLDIRELSACITKIGLH